jgi:homoserine/homoserine lactone efflux protein
MTLAMALGMSVGIKRTLWMMYGELIGVAILSILAILGVSAVMLNHVVIFDIFKYIGGSYLIYLGIQLWRSRGKINLSQNMTQSPIKKTRTSLFFQGLITALINPKGWAFMVSLLPPFIDPNKALTFQLIILVGIIMCCEFGSMMLYALGGKSLRTFIQRKNNIKIMNRMTGTVMIGIGVWLALG